MTPSQLEKALHELKAQRDALNPVLTAEINLLKSILHAQEAGRKKTYADARTLREVLELCLNLRGDHKLTKFEMVDDILDGGFKGNSPKSVRNLLRDSINSRVVSGVFTEKDGLVGRNPHPPKK
jgi:hypothetical protein